MTADVFSSIVQSMEAPLAQVMDIFLAADAMQPQRSAARDFAFAEEDEDEDEDVTSHPCGVETVELCPRAVGSDGWAIDEMPEMQSPHTPWYWRAALHPSLLLLTYSS